MVEFSPHSRFVAGQSIEIELGVTIDACSFRIRPQHRCGRATVQWTCDHCDASETLPASSAMSDESLVNYARARAAGHMMRNHAGPETLAFFETFWRRSSGRD